ncbi:MAG: DUF4380 domain-containing protein [Gemmataceae bacterium]|nr:DUF4380 domain-containing protein [Gemmataceae bacterium]MDW8266842.1 hypothetical protein [Gemmataceae bacterium]
MRRSTRLLAVLGVLISTAGPLTAQPASVTVEPIEYQGWKNNLRLSNGTVEIVATLEVGPRIISYRPRDGRNVFKEYPDQLGKKGETSWQIRGGHRLWISPEDPVRTYVPDNGPVHHERLGAVVRLRPAADMAHGLQKEIDLELAPTGTQVKVTHRVKNIGKEPTELAIWALSVMAPGGVEVIPLPPKRPHPGGPHQAKSAADFAPHQSLALWPYFDFQDSRWHFGRQFLTLRQDPNAKSPTKLGLSHRQGWVGYVNGGVLFVKRFGYQEGKTYPDHGSNYETFTNADMLELETLSPLVRLAPNTAVEHVETWELHLVPADAAADEARILQHIVPKVTGK